MDEFFNYCVVFNNNRFRIDRSKLIDVISAADKCNELVNALIKSKTYDNYHKLYSMISYTDRFNISIIPVAGLVTVARYRTVAYMMGKSLKSKKHTNDVAYWLTDDADIITTFYLIQTRETMHPEIEALAIKYEAIGLK